MSEFLIGLTGGVASGKSEVTRRFEALGVVVADADVAAREAVAVGSRGLAEVVAAFGAGMLGADGALDRAAMRRHVFADADARKRLETIVHPRVRAMLKAACEAAPGPYAIAAIPLLTEGGGKQTYPWLDRILAIDVPRETQLHRLMQRDGIDAALAEKMLATQATRGQRLAIADDVIVNDGPLDALDAQVAALDERYRALAAAA
ncbi:dephospho-CoA kinase [Luteimonas sp. SX5]|uniref:Dephospho-CoA kinase n=1 Tax=Luteimonas galliterrae TaxID=2940486 RepID=A0ABT0MI54_9GAMM|nr:dephospho-CoA kinase [Luteimonas galliterrae]MCL1634554.1 dephospho-CoA kinase [Luteimonas galliterrae]